MCYTFISFHTLSHLIVQRHGRQAGRIDKLCVGEFLDADGCTAGREVHASEDLLEVRRGQQLGEHAAFLQKLQVADQAQLREGKGE